MDSEKRLAEKLVGQVNKELGFRRQLTGYVAGVLRSDAPSSVKIFTLSILGLFVLVSFQFCILLIHVSCAVLHVVQISFVPYLYVFVAQSGGILVLGIPLMFRMSSLEEAKRLESELNVIVRKKESNRKGKDIGKPELQV